MSTLWPDTVRRGPMLREVRGLGTLVPEDTMLITARTDGRIERILVRPGTPVQADSVVMILSSPELENTLVTAEYALKAAQADYQNLKVTLQKQLFDMQAVVSGAEADYNIAKRQADRDAALAKEQLLPNVDADISRVKAQQLYDRLQIEKKRIATFGESEKTPPM
jgi:HlyD family secretion protein